MGENGVYAMMNYFKEDPKRTGFEFFKDISIKSLSSKSPFQNT
jgi:hypothetical protein